MSTLTYNSYLLITNKDAEAIRLISIQTNNTLILRTAAFLSLKEKKLKEAQF
jgi:hypothetical protein